MNETGGKGAAPGFNAADIEHVRGRQQKQKNRELQKKAALRGLMTSPEGRLWMWELLGICGVFRSSFSRDALEMAFSEGRRDIGNFLLTEVNRLEGGGQLYMKMALENGAIGRTEKE